MKTAPAFITALAIGFLVAGCGSGGSGNTPSQGGSGGGTSASGGAAGNASGGTAGNDTGGSAGSPSGGTTAISSGGGAGNGSGGETGGASGGATSSGGSTGATGGASSSGGSQNGGATGQAGGTPGSGGRTGATGGTSGTGGSQTGGVPGTGGATAPGTGGSTTPATALVTSASGTYWKTDGTWTEVTSGTADVTVNDSSMAQTWQGFGGAFNEYGWSHLSVLSSSDQTRAIDLLFGSDAAHFNFGRIPMGASDYSLARYTDDEVSAGGNDYSMASFSITQDLKYLIPYVKAAQAVNPNIHFWGSPWTPPTWMKTTSGSVNGVSCANTGSTPYDGGCMTDNAQVLTAYAQYFVKWIQAFDQQGIKIEAVAPQNEPNYATGYASCLWASPLFAKFVGQYLGPALSSASLSTQIMLGTMSNSNSNMDPTVVTAVMGDATAKGYIKMLGYQWGMLANVGSAKSYNLPIWQSEHKAGNYPFTVTGENPPPGPFNSTMAPNDYTYGKESWGLIRDWIKAGVVSYSAWNMVLDTVGNGNDTHRAWPQNALLTVDTSKKTLNLTPAYYVFRHLSQFVAPGAVVIGTSGGDALAFKNPDGTHVVVMYNSGAAKSTYTVSVGGKRLQFSMPADGFATIKM